MAGQDDSPFAHLHQRLDKHEHRLTATEHNLTALHRQQAVVEERHKNHKSETDALRALMDQLIDKVTSNTRAVSESSAKSIQAVSEVESALMQRMSQILLSLLIATMTGAFAVASSILVWWLSK